MESPTCGVSQKEWEAFSETGLAIPTGATDLQIVFHWNNPPGSAYTGYSVAVDDIEVVGVGGGTSFTVNDYIGPNGDSWGTNANWSLTDAPDTFTEDATIPAGKIVTVDAAYDVRNVCNYGEIIIDKAAGGQLNIEGNLLNEGIIRSTDANADADVRFVTGPSTYRGLGTNDDVDYQVASGGTSDLTLEADLSARSMTIDADVDFDTYTLTLKRDYTHNAGALTTANAKLLLDGPCGTCVDGSDVQDLNINAVGASWGKLEVNKSAGAATLFNGNLAVQDSFILRSGVFDQQTLQLSGPAASLQTGGGWHSSATVPAQPFLTGNFDLQNGYVRFEGTTDKLIKGLSFNELQIAGSGVHSLVADAEVRSLLRMEDNATLNTQANRLFGAGGLTMENDPASDPTLNLGTITAAPLPELSGTYTNLDTDGKIALSGNGAQTFKFLNGWRLGFEGAGVKSISSFLIANASLTFNQAGTVTLGNYVDTDGGSIILNDNTPDSLIHDDNPAATGGGHGHVVGTLSRAVDGANTYFYPLGADGSGALFYERAELRFTADFASITSVSANFSDNAPTPTDIPDVIDITDGGKIYGWLEDDGFWNFTPNDALDNTGAYTMEVFPSGGWTFSSAQYALLKTAPWTFHGSNKVSQTARENYTDFSGFGIGVQIDPLPVQATPLTATPNGDRITLNWLTFSETNNAGFELYRSTTPMDAGSFEQIAFIDPSQKQGEQKYVFDDVDVAPNVTYYYRYEQVDLDGQTARSNVASARLGDVAGTRLQVYPNPFSQRLTFDLMLETASEARLQILDATGRVVHSSAKTLDAGRAVMRISPEHLSAGMYHYTLRLDNGERYSGKLVYQP